MRQLIKYASGEHRVIDTDTMTAPSALAVPPITRQGAVRERRSNRMLPLIDGGNRAEGRLAA